MNVSIIKLVTNLLAALDVRQRDVIEGRYGLKDGNYKTLAEIGNTCQVTRERIRQIEAGALNALRNAASKNSLSSLIDLVKNHLQNVGGLRREELFLADLKMMVADGNAPNFGNKVRFLLEVAGEPKFGCENQSMYNYWYLGEENKKKASALIGKLVKLMNSRREQVVNHQDIDKLFNEAIKPHNLKDLVALNYISVSKDFHVNTYGDFGLANWPEVNPRTVRDWAYLILKKKQKPLHFSDIAGEINKVRKNSVKLAHIQTVHNELIKDSRFVLVGRGMYGLSEFGLLPGTAREVMARVLKEHGPLSPEELLGVVLKERLLKKNTVLINLRNRKYFKRLDDGKYSISSV